MLKKKESLREHFIKLCTNPARIHILQTCSHQLNIGLHDNLGHILTDIEIAIRLTVF